MALRDYIFNNFRWKLSALVLAIFVWFIIQIAMWSGLQQAIDNPFSDVRYEFFTNMPVRVMIRAEDGRAFQLDPPAANVEVQGRASVVNRLDTNDIKLFVDLTEMPNIRGVVREVQFSVPKDLDIRVLPPAVLVERISSPEKGVTNTVIQP